MKQVRGFFVITIPELLIILLLTVTSTVYRMGKQTECLNVYFMKFKLQI